MLETNWSTFPRWVLENSWPASDGGREGSLTVAFLIRRFDVDDGDRVMNLIRGSALAANDDMGWSMDFPESWGVAWTDVCLTPSGSLIPVDDASDPSTFRAWLAHLARQLADRGLSGVLSGARPSARLHWEADPAGVWPGLTTLFYRLDRSRLDAHSRPTPETPPEDPHHVLRVVMNWLSPEGAPALMRVEPQIGVGGVDCTPEQARSYFWRQLVEWNWSIGQVAVTAPSAEPRRQVLSLGGGQVQCDCQPSPDTWDLRVADCLSLLRHEASKVDLAVAPAQALTRGRVRHLLVQHLLAPAGIMVLSDAHLQNASSLDDWRVERVDQDRWLVQSRHLEAWFANPLPDVDAVACATQDFRGTLITDELWEQDLPYPQ